MEEPMKVRDAMTHDVRITNPDETILQAAQTMADLDAGVLPVGDHDRLVGMITDRDIAIRGIAEGKGPDTKVRDVMTSEVKYCFDDQEIDEVCRNMGNIKVRRLPVLDHSKRLVGILSLGDIALAQSNGSAGQALSGISRHGGEHSQTA
jgi:CBS domain-containing protein